MEQDPKLISIYMRSKAPVRQELINVQCVNTVIHLLCMWVLNLQCVREKQKNPAKTLFFDENICIGLNNIVWRNKIVSKVEHCVFVIELQVHMSVLCM